MELQGLSQEAFEVVAIVHEIAASLLQVELHFAEHAKLLVMSSDEHFLGASPDNFKGHGCSYFLYEILLLKECSLG